MNGDREQRIRKRAYEIWEEEGRTGSPDDHWLRAERELREALPDSGGIAVEDTLPTDEAAAADSAIR